VTPRQKPRLEIGSTNQSKSRELKNQFRRWALRARRVPPSLAGQPGGKTESATAHRTREWIPVAATEAGLANPIAGLKTRAGKTDGSRERRPDALWLAGRRTKPRRATPDPATTAKTELSYRTENLFRGSGKTGGTSFGRHLPRTKRNQE
jgi:hypothetical protein